MSSGIYEFTQAKIKNSNGIIQFSFWTMNFMDEALIALPLYSLANPSVHASAPPPFRGSALRLHSFGTGLRPPLHGGVG